jgi:hypothetical protein
MEASQHETELMELAAYLEGFAAAVSLTNNTASPFARASRWLLKLRQQGVCCEEVIGCRAGARCTSDHK